MRRFAVSVFCILCLTSAAAARVEKDISYAGRGGHALQRLDVYAPDGGSDRPILIFIHGGAWQRGDKSGVQRKPDFCNEQGFVFVSVNYRLHPEVDYRQQAGDVAGAIRFVRDHAASYGGSADRIYLMGHSAGAHLAALVACDDRYLKAAGMTLAPIKGVVLLDGAAYDVARQARQAALPRLRQLYQDVFGQEVEKQQDASPLAHVAAGKGIPPFLILYVATRADSRAQSEALAQKLKQAGVDAALFPAKDKNHLTINRDLGEPEDPPSKAILDFLRSRR
jgi:acetyl esterase/lipase